MIKSVCVSFWLVSAKPSPISPFPIRLDLLSIFVLHSAEKYIRMQGNVYKRHTIPNKRLMIITNVLASVKWLRNMLGMCFSYDY